MKVTAKQARVLSNLDRIVVGTVGKKPVPFLDGEDCRFQLFSLCARGLVAFGADGAWIKIADADGIIGAPSGPAPDGTSESVR